MPYCAQCGKLITEETLMKNNGECNECHPKETPVNLDLNQPESKFISTNLKHCAYCHELTSVYCVKCKKALCQKHIMIYAHVSNGQILCEKCHSDESSTSYICCCLCLVFLLPFIVLMNFLH